MLVDPTDEEAIADGIRRFATDLRFREDYRLRGRARAKQFTWDRAAAQTVVALLQGIAGSELINTLSFRGGCYSKTVTRLVNAYG